MARLAFGVAWVMDVSWNTESYMPIKISLQLQDGSIAVESLIVESLCPFERRI